MGNSHSSRCGDRLRGISLQETHQPTSTASPLRNTTYASPYSTSPPPLSTISPSTRQQLGYVVVCGVLQGSNCSQVVPHRTAGHGWVACLVRVRVRSLCCPPVLSSPIPPHHVLATQLVHCSARAPHGHWVASGGIMNGWNSRVQTWKVICGNVSK